MSKITHVYKVCKSPINYIHCGNKAQEYIQLTSKSIIFPRSLINDKDFQLMYKEFHSQFYYQERIFFVTLMVFKWFKTNTMF
jgi:hypothetical protein